MNLGSLATIARQAPPNLVHIVWDNQMWYETGGQPTHTSTGTDLGGVALASGIRNVARASTVEAFEEALDQAIQEPGPWFIHVDIEETGEPPPAPARSSWKRTREVPPHLHRIGSPPSTLTLDRCSGTPATPGRNAKSAPPSGRSPRPARTACSTR